MFFIYPFCWRKKKTVEELAKRCDKPWKIAMYMYQRIWYKRDIDKHGIADYWQSPEETLLTHSGDCEDYALLAHEALKIQGIPSRLLGIYYKTSKGSEGHMVCVYYNERKKRYYHMGNWGYWKGKKTFNETAITLRKTVIGKEIIAWREYLPTGKMIAYWMNVAGEWRKISG